MLEAVISLVVMQMMMVVFHRYAVSRRTSASPMSMIIAATTR